MAKKKALRVVRINRAKWLTGEVLEAAAHPLGEKLPSDSGLLKDGFQCCLGFVCETLGVSRVQLQRAATPAELADPFLSPNEQKRKGLTALLRNLGFVTEYNNDAPLMHSAMGTNDNRDIGRMEREIKIKEALAIAGWKVMFYGKYPEVLKQIKIAREREDKMAQF